MGYLAAGALGHRISLLPGVRRRLWRRSTCARVDALEVLAELRHFL